MEAVDDLPESEPCPAAIALVVEGLTDWSPWKQAEGVTRWAGPARHVRASDAEPVRQWERMEAEALA